MNDPRVISIYLHSSKRGPMTSSEAASAVLGCGLEGDAYCDPDSDPDTEVSLIEAEAIEGFVRETEIELTAAEMRRNLVTRNVALNHLVGREFTIGEARFRGIRLCEPCSHLQKMIDKPVVKGMAHRGGLRAQVVKSGMIRVGDRVRTFQA